MISGRMSERQYQRPGELRWALLTAPRLSAFAAPLSGGAHLRVDRRNRRMSKDYEFLPATSEAWVYQSMVRVMLNRLAHEQVQPPFHYRRVACALMGGLLVQLLGSLAGRRSHPHP